MILNKIIATLVISVAAASASAQSDSAAGDTVIRKVETVYVRESRGLYIEKNLLRKTAGRELWVYARAATELATETAGELFKVPTEIAIERGDLVTTRIGDPSASLWNLIPEVNKVTLLVAKHDTLAAMVFGLSDPQTARGPMQAQACYAPTRIAYAGEFPR